MERDLAEMKARMEKDMEARTQELEADAAWRLQMLEQHFRQEKDARVEEILGLVLR